MKKNKDEILEAATELQKQADELPPHGMFGDNAEDIEQMENWASELRTAAEGGSAFDEDVILWLDGRPSDIDDAF
ncbi:MAG: hypothetical protein HRT93_03405 [Piscirickettsiaceae bacterium]|nr:hypothetical protein [Piscirickettsiaceae bacterium]